MHRQRMKIRPGPCFDYCATCCEVIVGGVMMSGVCACSCFFFFLLFSITHARFREGTVFGRMTARLPMPTERFHDAVVTICH